MLVSKLYSKIDELYEQYRMIEFSTNMNYQVISRLENLLGDSLNFAEEIVNIIEQIEMELQQNNN